MPESVDQQIRDFVTWDLVASGWTFHAAQLGAAVALSATGIDLDFARNGMCTAFGFPDKIVHALGFKVHGPYSAQLTAQIGAAVTINGTQWQWAPTAWKGTPQPDKHVLNGLQKGSLAAGDLPRVKRATRPQGGSVGGGGAGIAAANKGWETFRGFVATDGPRTYGRIVNAHNAIKGVRR